MSGDPVPGSVEAIQQTSSAWNGRSAECARAAHDLTAVTIDGWKGVAASVYHSKRDKMSKQFGSLSETLETGGRILDVYAAALASNKSDVSAAEGALKAARVAMLSSYLPIFNNPSPSDLVKAVGAFRLARDRFDAVVGDARDEATRAANALLATIGMGPVIPALLPIMQLLFGQETPDRPVGEEVLRNEDWDPTKVSQNQIGDCYLISALMSEMGTEAGLATMQRNVRWDAQAQGYWVTLYIDGKPTDYFVDRVYSFGATSGGSPSVVSLYEAAVGQAISFGDLTDGGHPEWAFEVIDGKSAVSIDASSGILPPVETMRAHIDAGKPVVAWTNGANDYTLHHVTVERADGTTATRQSIDILNLHAYSVERVDPDGGVWVRNPHGPGNGTDSGDLIRLSRKDFTNTFHEIDLGGL